MIPEQWIEDRRTLAIFQHQQRAQLAAAAKASKPLVLDEGEELVTDAHFAALNELLVTDADLTELGTIGRGQYRAGDRRGYVTAREQDCDAWNCWMVRADDGSERYVSEAPAR